MGLWACYNGVILASTSSSDGEMNDEVSYEVSGNMSDEESGEVSSEGS